jgi:hypothetical protein
MQHNPGIEKLQVLVREKETDQVTLVWSLPYSADTGTDLWVQGQVEVRGADDPDYLFRVRYVKFTF